MPYTAPSLILFFTRLLAHADIYCVKEPVGLSRLSGKRSDGLTLIAWKLRKCALWDVTIADTTLSYISITSQSTGSAAEHKAYRKREKYVDLAKNHVFVPIMPWRALVLFVPKV